MNVCKIIFSLYTSKICKYCCLYYTTAALRSSNQVRLNTLQRKAAWKTAHCRVCSIYAIDGGSMTPHSLPYRAQRPTMICLETTEAKQETYILYSCAQ